MNTPIFKQFRILYTFNNSKFGFNNSVTVTALNYDQAVEKAKHEVAMCYGSEMLKKFSFKETAL